MTTNRTAASLCAVALCSAWLVSGARALGSETAATPAAPASTREPAFYVGEFRVSGNTLLTPLQIEQVLGSFLGERKTFTDVEAARETLELRYRDLGYGTVIVNIPEQDVVDGVVTLEVVEGKVASVRVTGSRYFSLERVRGQVPALAEGAVPFLPDAQAQLAALNARTADRSITPVLRPGRTPGTLEVELRVKDEFPLHGDIELNNRYSANTTELRAIAGLRYDNLWQREHSLSLQYQTSPEDTEEVQVWSGTYLGRFTGSDNLLVLYGVRSDSDTATVGDLSVIGKGRILGLRGVVPLAGGQDYYHSLSMGFDYKDFDEAIELQGADTLQTPIEYVNWSLQYNATMRRSANVLRYSLGPNFGIRGIENDPTEFDDKRYRAKPNYLYLRGDVDYNRRLLWETRLQVRVEGQLAAGPLVSNEQFSAGGAQSVRGYLESTALGDDGVAGSVEWRTPSWASNVGAMVDELILFGFVDAASLRIRQPLPEQTDHYDLYSAGIGARLSALKNLTVDLDGAWALADVGATARGDSRVHFKLVWSF